MFASTVTNRQVKEAFALAQAMKHGPFDPERFRARLALAKRQVSALPDRELDESLIDRSVDPPYTHRQRCYGSGAWAFGIVELAACQVWDYHLVPVVATSGEERAKRYRRHPLETIPLKFVELPLIVLRRESTEPQYQIDDGCNRAVTYYLAGYRRALAYVGRVPRELIHKWEWPV